STRQSCLRPTRDQWSPRSAVVLRAVCHAPAQRNMGANQECASGSRGLVLCQVGIYCLSFVHFIDISARFTPEIEKAPHRETEFIRKPKFGPLGADEVLHLHSNFWVEQAPAIMRIADVH